MNKTEISKKIKAGNFASNNGKVIRVINMLRYEFDKVSSIDYALIDVNLDEVLDSVNYLFEAGYIHLRDIETKESVCFGLADTNYKRLEAKLTAKGIRLLAFTITDPLVEV